MTRAIDVWFNLLPPEVQEKLFSRPDLQLVKKVEKLDRPGGLERSTSPDDLVASMDEAGVDITLLVPMKQGHGRRMRLEPESRLILDVSYRDLLPYVDAHPTRFRGLYGINPWTVMDGVREMEDVVRGHGFVGAVTHAAGFAPFNDKIWFPFYAKCVELDIPVISQIGHFAEPLPEGHGHPLMVDEVAEIFPELRLVAGHTGWPWCDELIAVALKHPNVYVGMEAHLPKYWEPSMVRFISTRGQDKVMWGTDWPVTDAKRNLEQVQQLGLKDEVKQKLLRDNAVRVFKL